MSNTPMSNASTLEELFQLKLPSVQTRLQEALDGCGRLKVSFYDLRSGEQHHFNGDQPGWAASMIKVPVMIAAFRQIEEGKLSLENSLVIDHRFTLDPTSEISYREQGSAAEVKELLAYMILASCNESTNMLANRVGISYINETMRRLGCPSTRMSHLLCRGAPLVDPGIDGTSSNTTTANEMTNLMAGIYLETVASPASCRQMRAILENSPDLEYGGATVNNILSAGLPVETRVGAKMGLLEEDVMETAVINGDYALTVMANKVPSAHLSLLSSQLLPVLSKEIFKRYYHGKQETTNGDRERV